jgi:hypothetical protein
LPIVGCISRAQRCNGLRSSAGKFILPGYHLSLW